MAKKNFPRALFAFLFMSVAAFPFSLYFTPNRATDQIIIDLVRNAEKSVYIASYSFSWKALADELDRKKGIDIRIIVDGAPASIDRVKAVKVDRKSSLFHPKFMVVDGRCVILGSGNFTQDNLRLHHNHFIFFEDEKIAAILTEKFNSWWQGEIIDSRYEEGNMKIYFSPENDCRGLIGKVVASAKNEVRFAMYHFTSQELARVLIDRKLAGVKVYGMIESFSVEPHSVCAALSNFGCAVRKSNRAGFLHDKFIIVDGETVITGSYNLTAAAERNTEVVVVIKDRKLASEFMEEWKKMWRYFSLP